MTKLTTSREIRLASRPKGTPTAVNFTLAEIALPALQAQQVLVQNLFLSVDPYMRGRMNEGKSYVPPFAIGQALEGGAIGAVVESRADEFKPGDVVTSRHAMAGGKPSLLRRKNYARWTRRSSHSPFTSARWA